MSFLKKAGVMVALCVVFCTPVRADGLDALSNAEAGSGLKEALAKGAEYAVSTLGKENGFLGNDQVRIGLPGSLQKAESALRMFGGGKYVDDLVGTMNHAAEQAVGEAKPVLLDALKKMSVEDAKGVLAGGQDSATQYFRKTTSETLTQRFLPIVKQATQKVQLADKYNQFAGKAAGAGLLDSKDANLEGYITQKTLDGLFVMVAEQEKAIRQDPVGTGSKLLGKVFGAAQ